jgi:hypothetical protein
MRHPEPDNIKNMESQPPANLNFWIRELPKTVPKKLPKKKLQPLYYVYGIVINALCPEQHRCHMLMRCL